MSGKRRLMPAADDVMRRGKSIRLAAVVGAVAVAAVLAGYAALTHWQAPPAVTDVTAAPGSAPDLVASGEVGNASWQIIVRPYAARPGQVCWFGHGPAFGNPASEYESTSEACGKLQTPLGTAALPPGVRPDPVQFGNFAQEQVQVALGVVGADVMSVVLRLDHGQQLKLIPVKRYEYRLVAFVIPRQAGIASATAYLNNGQYATTIPYNSGGLTFFGPWLWQGARGH
jgi:hypothetical protein